MSPFRHQLEKLTNSLDKVPTIVFLLINISLAFVTLVAYIGSLLIRHFTVSSRAL